MLLYHTSRPPELLQGKLSMKRLQQLLNAEDVDVYHLSGDDFLAYVVGGYALDLPRNANATCRLHQHENRVKISVYGPAVLFNQSDIGAQR